MNSTNPEGSRLININTAKVDDLTKLYGISKVLGQRIIEYRNEHGYFQTPDQLQNVEGISHALAITLSPHIDWSFPNELPETKEREWFYGILFFLSASTTIWWFIRLRIPTLQTTYHYYLSGYQWALTRLWREASLVFIFVVSIIIIVIQIIAVMTVDLKRALRFLKYSVYGSLLIVLGALSSGASEVIYYSFFSSNGWQALLENPWDIAVAVTYIVAIIRWLPAFLALTSYAFATKPLVSRIYDIGILFSIPAIIWSFSLDFSKHAPFSIPVLIVIPELIVGFLFANIGYNTLRTGESFFSQTLFLFDLERKLHSQADITAWQAWINVRLPDPEQQKALKKALDQAYPPSRSRTLISFIVLGAGGWLIVTSLGAIVEWIVQNVLETLIH